MRDLPSNPRLDDVLRATATALWNDGYDRLSVETLARRAGVSRSTVYRHWADKRSLVVAAVADFLDRHFPIAAPGPGLDAVEELRRFVSRLARLGDSPDVVRVALDVQRKTSRDEDFGRLWTEQVVEPRRSAVVNLLRSAISSGQMRDDLDVDIAADALIGGLYYRLLVQPRAADERFGEVLVATVVAGFDHAEEHFADVFDDQRLQTG